MLHVICKQLRPRHLGVHVGDSSQRTEEIVKKSGGADLNAIIIIIIIIANKTFTNQDSVNTVELSQEDGDVAKHDEIADEDGDDVRPALPVQLVFDGALHTGSTTDWVMQVYDVRW